MAHLTLAGLSDDGKRLLLVDDNGVEFTLDSDAPLRAALSGDHARIGQLEKKMESALRPRDIQTRIRGGESPEAVAQAAHTSVDKIMAFAAPVMAERAHIAGRAQNSSLRRKSGETGARTLGEAVATHLRAINFDPTHVEWDAWRREDGRWTLTGLFATPHRQGSATYAFDVRGNFVTSEDEDARWLVGESPDLTADTPAARDDLQQARTRRLSAVPADELPLGVDAIELVTDGSEAGDEPGATETTLDLTDALGIEQPAHADVSASEGQPDDAPAHDPAAAVEPQPDVDPAADEPPARRPARKGRGRASVPSWDEIMFGGPSGE